MRHTLRDVHADSFGQFIVSASRWRASPAAPARTWRTRASAACLLLMMVAATLAWSGDQASAHAAPTGGAASEIDSAPDFRDADKPGATGAEAEAKAEPKAALLERVAILGASASSGFNVVGEVEIDGQRHRAPIDLGDVFACTRQDGGAPAVEAASFLFFTNPGPMGSTLATRAEEAEPTLLLAVDYLFWFGYGPVEEPEIPARLALLEKGLANLERFACPMIVGDFPDMSGAIGSVLRRNQVPSPEALKALNARLEAWIEEHPHAQQFGLSAFMSKIAARESITVGGHTWAGDEVGTFLQRDRLHPTLEGLVAIAFAATDLVGAIEPRPGSDLFRRDVASVRACIQDTITARIREKIDAAAAAAAAAAAGR